MHRINLIIFDCDGVLVDSEIIAARVFAREVTALGYPLSAVECLERYTGIKMQTVIEDVEARWGRALPADFESHIRRCDFAEFAIDLKPVEGIAEVLRRLPMPRCVASSGTPEKIRFTLGATGLLPLLEPHLFSAKMVARGKPAPDLFWHAAAAMGADPVACVVIEDSVPGIEAARAAGMAVFGFAGASHCGPGYGQRLREAGAAVVFEAMADLPALIDH